MKTLLEKAQTAIRASLSYIRPVDVFITPHENYIPPGTQLPAVGIKDGGIKRTKLMGGDERDEEIKIKFIPYVKFYSTEQVIMGTDAAKGVLDVVDDLHEALEDNFLADPGMEEVFCGDEKESENFGKEGDGLQRKILTYQYERRVAI